VNFNALRTWSQSREWSAAIVVCVILAIGLRVSNQQIFLIFPDSYLQLEGAKNLLELHFPPFSPHYQPGGSVIMAPFLLLLPRDFVTMQAVIIAFGVGTVILGYWGVIKYTRDKFAAAFLGFALAADPGQVLISRAEHHDTILGFLLLASLLVAKPLSGRGLLQAFLWGCVVAVALNIRITNAIWLPAMLVLWVGIPTGGLSIRAIMASLSTPQIVVFSCTLVLGNIFMYVLGGGNYERSGSFLSFDRFFSNILDYEWVILGGILVGFIAPLVILGSGRLWRVNRPLAIALLWIMFVSPIVHAPFHFAEGRYMLPAVLCSYFVAAHGASVVWSWSKRSRAKISRASVAFAFVVLAAIMIVASSALVLKWRTIVANHEAIIREMRPEVANLDDGAMLISAYVLAVRNNDRVTYFDLLEYMYEHGTDTSAISELTTQVQMNLDADLKVYYLYSKWEDGDAGGYDSLGRGKFIDYFEALKARFTVKPIRGSDPDQNKGLARWMLYVVEK
jgi:hypothetical protein